MCSAWTFCIALQLWLAVARGYSKRNLDKLRKYMIAFSCFLFGIILIPLGEGQIGHEWTGGTLHFCLYKITTKVTTITYIITSILLLFLLKIYIYVCVIAEILALYLYIYSSVHIFFRFTNNSSSRYDSCVGSDQARDSRIYSNY
jgi:hypothetical protein